MSSATAFNMNLTISGVTATIDLTGEIDVASSDRIAELGTATVRTPGVESLVLDMSAVTFLDSTGLGALIHIRDAASPHGVTLGLRRPALPVQRILDLTGTTSLFDITEPAADPA